MKTTPTSLRTSLRVLTCAAALAVTGAYADAKTPDDPPAATARTDHGSSLERGDRRFLEKAAKAGQEEVEISKIALERTTNADVKNFAQMMLDDHGRANEEVAALAQKYNVELPAKGTDEDKWRRRDAKDFDRDYVKKMVSAHKDAVELFQKEAKDGTAPDVLEFARKTLPKLERHYERANDLKKMVR